MTAFPIPPYDYASVGPYWVTAEYRGEKRCMSTADQLERAVGQWLGFGSVDAYECIRRTVTDARGVLVLGWLTEPAWELPVVATAEVFEMFRACGAEPLGLLDFELEMMTRQTP